MIKEFKVLAIIPARGGSKRIPYKNIKLLFGKPLIAYTIEEAKKSQYIDRVIVSTDSEEIKKVSLGLNGEVPFLRPEELSDDNSTDFGAFAHAVNWLKENENYIPDIVVQLRPTSPLRLASHIDRAIELLAENPGSDSVRTVTEPEQSPYKMYKINDEGLLSPLLKIDSDKESFNLPQSSLPKVYKHVGYVDVFWLKTITEKKMMTGDNILPLIIEDATSGINTMKDWEYYEYLIKRRNHNE